MTFEIRNRKRFLDCVEVAFRVGLRGPSSKEISKDKLKSMGWNALDNSSRSLPLEAKENILIWDNNGPTSSFVAHVKLSKTFDEMLSKGILKERKR